MTDTKRKGARSTKDIPHDILSQLNAGFIETANLVEWLAVDQLLLLEIVLKTHNRLHYLGNIHASIEHLPKRTVSKQIS